MSPSPTPERWQQIQRVMEAALEHDIAERAEIIDRLCAGDAALKKEVESLLAYEDQAQAFLDEPAVNLPTSAPADNINSSDKKASLTGKVLKERYVIERELGQGGFATVFLAHDRQLLSKPVVVKVLLEHAQANKWVKKKFLQEIEALARIDHPGVVGIFDTGELEDGKPFFVMQFVEGVNLRTALKGEGLELARVASIIQQLGASLGAAHEKGIYHRDLKPENIMVQRLSDGDEVVKLIDFGMAKVKDSQAGNNSSAQMIAGTLTYMSPEQLKGESASAASDIFALGVIAYEMITGRRPFDVDKQLPVAMMMKHLLEIRQAGIKIRPQDLRPDLPAAVAPIILKATAFDAAHRYQRAKEFGEELARALTGGERSSPQSPFSLWFKNLLSSLTGKIH